MNKIAALIYFLVYLSPAIAVNVNPEPDLDLWTQGVVYSVTLAPDGKLYVAGAFSLFMGEPRSNLARVLPDGSLDDTYAPTINGPVYNVLLLGKETALISGDFTRVGTNPQGRVAKVLGDGTLDESWTPTVNGSVFAVALAEDESILIGGDFNRVNDLERVRLAKLNLDDGSVHDWVFNANGRVLSILNTNNGDVWIGGAFLEINGITAERLAVIDSLTDQVFDLQSNSNVNELSESDDGSIYVCGQFTSVSGVERFSLARFDQFGVIDTSWAPSLNGRAIDCTSSGSQLLVAGEFSEANGTPVGGAARFDALDGTLDTSFVPNLTGITTGLDGAFSINAEISQLDPATVFIGGVFRRVNGLPASSGAILSTSTGELLLPYDAEREAIVRSILELDSLGWLIGGQFRRAGNTLLDNVLLIDSMGEIDLNWDIGTNGDVYAMQKYGSSVILAGLFSDMGGRVRNGIGKVNLLGRDSEVDSKWSPSFDGRAFIYSLDIDQSRENSIYAGGSFTTSPVNGYSVSNFARINLTLTGEVDGALLDMSLDGLVLAIDQSAGGELFLGGSFSSVRGVSRRGLAVFSNNNELTFINEYDAELNSNVLGLTATNKNALYVVGQFSRSQGEDRAGAAKLDGGRLAAWAPTLTGGAAVSVMVDTMGGVYLIGNFERVNGVIKPLFARVFDGGEGQLDADFNVQINGDLLWTSHVDQSTIFLGGAFEEVNSFVRRAIASLEYVPSNADKIFNDNFDLAKRRVSPAQHLKSVNYARADIWGILPSFPFETSYDEFCESNCPRF